MVFQPNQEELESIVDGLRKKLDENRRMARAEMSANASAIHTPNASSPTSRTCSPNHGGSTAASVSASAENGSKTSQQLSEARRKKHRRSRSR